MKKVINLFILYILVMLSYSVIIGFLPCETALSITSFTLFIVHMLIMICSIIVMRKAITDGHRRFLYTNVVIIIYLLLLFLSLQLPLFMVKC